MNIIGIDPGQDGAAAMIRQDGSVDIAQFNQMTEADISDALECWKQEDGELFAYYEKAQPMRKEGRRQGVSSSFKFGDKFGLIRGMLIALKIPFEYVTPNTWQKALSCQSKGDKNVTKQKAQQLFPTQKIIHATADALLIAEYGRRNRAGL